MLKGPVTTTPCFALVKAFGMCFLLIDCKYRSGSGVTLAHEAPLRQVRIRKDLQIKAPHPGLAVSHSFPVSRPAQILRIPLARNGLAPSLVVSVRLSPPSLAQCLQYLQFFQAG
jgi:hypothetical protein